jgi:medium-chain acyl-[acyl-carrier-protein] hydrolase
VPRRLTDSLFRLSPDRETRLRLVCVPPAGGWYTTFEPWGAVLPPQVDLCAVTLPGHGIRLRETPLTDIRAMAEGIAGELAELPQHPYVVFGHSMGGLIAFETVRALRRRGLPPPRALGVSGIRAPHIAAPPSDWRDPARVVDRLRELQALPHHVLAKPKLMDALLPAFQADLTATDSYRAGPAALSDLPLLAWAGVNDPATGVPEVSAWRECSSGPFLLTVLDAGHSYLTDHAGVIARPLVDSLAGAAPGDVPGGPT